MKKILTEIEWFLDFYIGFVMTNGNKTHVYHERMTEKWGKKYLNRIEMKEQTITVFESPRYTDVYVECPNCGHCEQHPADEQRHHIQTFDIVEWVEETPEVSVMRCHPCKEEFRLTWDYNNIEVVEDDEEE